MEFHIDASPSGEPFDHFWKSTGFTPADLLLTPDMQQMLAYAGSLPYRGLTYMRIHYQLELVDLEVHGEIVHCGWQRLDQGLDVLVRNGLKPFFELMGNPSGVFTSFRDDHQLRLWKELVANLARHCLERYGRDEVLSWYFETWNEPDAGWWPEWPGDLDSFCRYYDACSEGLREADPALRFGGPGTCVTLSDLFKALLAHCDRGVNHFTGETGVRLDFISIHEKAARACKEDLTPDSGAVWRREAAVHAYIRSNHPRFSATPFMNNECDPQVGWKDFHTWHARPYYAAMVCKVVNQHLLGLRDGLGLPYALLSNDNAFLGQWGNRTLLARFGDDSHIEDGQSKHLLRRAWQEKETYFPPFELVKKPVLNALALLALSGEQRCRVSGQSDPDSDLGLIATRTEDGQVAALVYHSADRLWASGGSRVKLVFENLPPGPLLYVHYRIDERHGDPFAIWEAQGAPPQSSPQQFRALRQAQELALLDEPRQVQARMGQLDLGFDLPLPGVSLVLLLPRPEQGPAQVSGLRLERYRGLAGERQVMAAWEGLPARTLRTYQVLRAETPQGPFQQANSVHLICSAFLDVPDEPEIGRFYQVRAVDWWGRVGEASPVAEY